MKDFEFIEHTADIGVRVYGKNIEELFKNAARALFELLTDYKPKHKKEEKIYLEADSLEELLVTWLNELISIFFTYRFLPAEFNLSIEEAQGKKTLKTEIFGDEFNASKNKIKTEVKAATYHNLKIEKDEEGFKAEIIFDV